MMQKPPAIIDSHCHLDFPQFSDDLDALVDRARQVGVQRMLTICTRPGSVDRTIEIAEAHEEIYFAAGVHPHYAAEEADCSVDELLSLATHPKMAGIGESGLDFHYTSKTARAQLDLFRVHIEAARQSQLPLIVHSRAADEAMMKTLREEFDKGPFKCVMHCYSSGAQLARLAVDLGCYLSMSGIVTFKNAGSLREVFSEVPANRVLVETDAPYLAPEPSRGKRNEPALVRHVVQAGARIAGMDYAAFAAQSTGNFLRLFTRVHGIPSP
ncbi:MAG: TatD family hydrolase [Rhodobacteraceae bacterium]|nr:TatD family hydrolase [Paracoccaceae bacterium]